MTATDGVVALLDAVRAERAARREAEKLHAREHAPGFNVVELLGPGENRLSNVFRWLLDERESHGQEARFREMFFDSFPEAQIAGVDWRNATVGVEVPTREGRRMDLLVESMDRRAALVIENKPWAGWQDQQLESYWLDRRVPDAPERVRVLALVGGVENAQTYVEEHWRAHPDASVFPSGEVMGVGYDRVTAWVERCAEEARPVKVRGFLLDLASYCRRSILWEPSMTETRNAADLILAGGENAFRAAHAIVAALPLAMTRDVASRVGGVADQVGDTPVVRVTVDGVPLAFALFDVSAPWAGVTDAEYAAMLRGEAAWGSPEKLWPRWAYLKKSGEHGRALAQAAASGEPDAVARLIPAAARVLLGG